MVTHPGHLQNILHSFTSRRSSYHPCVTSPRTFSNRPIQCHIPDVLKSSHTVSHSGHFHIILHSATSRTFSHHHAEFHIPDIFKSSHTVSHPGHLHMTVRRVTSRTQPIQIILHIVVSRISSSYSTRGGNESDASYFLSELQL